MPGPFYIDPDASGTDNGLSWINAYPYITGDTSLQAALEQADDTNETLIYIKSASTAKLNGEYAITAADNAGSFFVVAEDLSWLTGTIEVSGSTSNDGTWVVTSTVGTGPTTINVSVAPADSGADGTLIPRHNLIVSLGGSGVGASTNKHVKVIGCDSGENPITTRGETVTIQANSTVDAMVSYTGTPDRVSFQNITFDCNSKATYGVRTNGLSGAVYFHSFINCFVTDPISFGIDFTSSMRVVYIFDCDLHGGNQNALKNAAIGARIINTKLFGNAANYTLYDLSSYNSFYLGCLFDAENGLYCLLINGSFGGGNFVDCACRNYTVARTLINGQQAAATNFNVIDSAADPANDFVYDRNNSDDAFPEMDFGCISNADGTPTALLGSFSDLASMLAPYKTLTALNTEGSSGDIISAADPRWNLRGEIKKGHIDLLGSRGTAGIENIITRDARQGLRHG